jgi:transposase-like protein
MLLCRSNFRKGFSSRGKKPRPKCDISKSPRNDLLKSRLRQSASFRPGSSPKKWKPSTQLRYGMLALIARTARTSAMIRRTTTATDIAESALTTLI